MRFNTPYIFIPKSSRRVFGVMPAFVLAQFFFVCRNPAMEIPKPVPIAQDPELKHWTEVFMGVTLSPDNPLQKFTNLPAYAKFKEDAAQFWGNHRAKSGAKISEFQLANVPQTVRNNPVFYPLSGPDFINAHLFFPDAPLYLLTATEKVIPLPKTGEVAPEVFSHLLASLQGVLVTISPYNYFTSNNMRLYLNEQNDPGLLPVLLAFCGHMGLKVLKVEEVEMTGVGELVAPTGPLPDEANWKSAPPRGMRLVFTKNDRYELQQLIYLRYYLNPDSFRPDRNYGGFLAKAPEWNLMLKAAVYLLHLEAFAGAVKDLQAKVRFVIQDDSGIPYRMFPENRWEVGLFGNYTEPVMLTDLNTAAFRQADLRAAYQKKHTDIEFAFGYGSLRGKGEPNLQTALKKSGAAVEKEKPEKN